MNQRGQALVESLGALPVICSLFVFLFGVSHSLFVYYLSDHWNYEAAFCLAKEKRTPVCRQELLARLSQLPFTEFQILEFSKTSNRARTSLLINSPFLKEINFKEDFHLPLTSEMFGGQL